jgi:ankyrin repeat protein
MQNEKTSENAGSVNAISAQTSAVYIEATPLLKAIKSGADAKMVRLLVDNGADVNAKDSFDMTPLLAAVMRGADLKTIRILLEAGADPSIVDCDGLTALHAMARRSGEYAEEGMRMLVQHGANVNLLTRHQGTALHTAVGRDDVALCGAFLRQGADAYQEHHAGFRNMSLNALELAVKLGHAKVVRALVEEHGVDPVKALKSDPAVYGFEKQPKMEKLVEKLKAKFARAESTIPADPQSAGPSLG